MPQSASCNRKPILNAISNIIFSENLESIDILDLGIGKGNFGKLIKENIKIPTKITGVEIWEKYRNKNWGYYDEVIITEIYKFLKEDKRKCDIILLIDVIEHFTEEEGKVVLRNVIDTAERAVIVSTPITPYPQKAIGGNLYEEHKSIWTDAKLTALGFRAIDRKRIFGLFWPPFAKIGIYIYKK